MAMAEEMRAQETNSTARGIAHRLARFGGDEQGATAVEYGLIALGIGIAIVVGIDAIGTALNVVFETTLAGEF
jgi:pilus assembly protein Flp/PilA